MSRSARLPKKRNRALFAAAVLAVPTVMLTASVADPTLPVARKKPTVRELYGDRFVDDYFWLREKGTPEVQAYLEAENAYAERQMGPHAAIQQTLYDEMLGRIKQTDLSVPVRDGGYYYYTRTEQGQQYAIYCRRKGSPDAPEEVYLDLNQLAKGESFMAIGALSVSDDGNLLAYTTDTTGFREYRLYVRDLRTGELLERPAEKVTSVDWAADNRTLFYTTTDPAKRPYRLYRHSVGSADDALLYEEKDERFSVGVGRSRSKGYLFLEIGSLTASEVHYLAADQPSGTWRIVAPRQDDHEYDVEHRGDQFFIRTNQGGRNFSLAVAPVSDPSRANWKTIVAHRPDVMLQGVLVFEGYTVLYERAGGLPRFRVAKAGAEATPGGWTSMPFPEAAYTVSPSANPEFATPAFRYTYQSFTTPPSVFEYDFASGKPALLKETEVLGGYDRTKYTTERLLATAPDGTRVPVSLVYAKTLVKDGTAPIYLTAYGSYGLSSNVTFNSNRFSLIDRGVVVALAHIRGGGDMGKPWHDDGRMLHKKNTFTDFIAVAEFLVGQKYGAPGRLAIEGGSAGGLLMGAVTNMRPDLFKAVVAQVPFVDVINTMTDTTLPLTVGEFEEWGNPAASREAYDYIRSYDPYRNVAAKAYPAMLVKTSLNDSQVMYWEPAKYVARMRALKTDTRPLIFKINMAAGHGGSSGRYDRLKEVAFDYSFILWQLGLEGAGSAAAH
jgi:oligopeptidase B